mmetsp:Transcript_52099/g.111512  ORF Transcript_52099/g.111512 Transcript_52099/m.111512 type:complete len:295 (+) Transcript_52099:73-957(+)
MNCAATAMLRRCVGPPQFWAPHAASRAFAAASAKRPIFFDMIHSNNAARIRIWTKLKGLTDEIDCRMVTYPDLQSEEFKKVNPLKKVPAFITADGDTLFESAVILSYMEDVYDGHGPSFKLDTPEERARVQLFCRLHDLYIASPNCTQPGFSHTQGAMYLAPYETKWCRPERAMDRATRAAKLAELWKQLTWLENNLVGPYMAGSRVTIADMTWYPTCIFMEYMLPRVFDWPEIFHEETHFPRLTAWFAEVSKHNAFASTRQDIWDFWVAKDAEGQFDSIRDERKDPAFKWVYP